jgi:hypothetical protein
MLRQSGLWRPAVDARTLATQPHPSSRGRDYRTPPDVATALGAWARRGCPLWRLASAAMRASFADSRPIPFRQLRPAVLRAARADLSRHRPIHPATRSAPAPASLRCLRVLVRSQVALAVRAAQDGAHFASHEGNFTIARLNPMSISTSPMSLRLSSRRRAIVSVSS